MSSYLLEPYTPASPPLDDIEARVRIAAAVREHRYTLPVVREIPRAVGHESLDRSVW